jgi:transposase
MKTLLSSARLQYAERDQVKMETRSLDQMLPPDHVARTVWAYVCGLDLSALLAKIKAVEGGPGQPAIDPRLLLSLWLLATLDGVGSARQLDRLCALHMAYEWLCGDVGVNYHTLADFRTENETILSELLTQSVATLLHQGLVDLKEVALDGLRVRASAGKSSFKRREKLEECLRVAKQQVETLRVQADEDEGAVSRRQEAARERAVRERLERVEQALQEQKRLAERPQFRLGKDAEPRASLTDPQAHTMKMPDGGFRPAYNAQLATDTASGIIVVVDVITVGSDSGQLRPMTQQIEQRFQKSPERMLADGDFANHDDIDALAEKKIDVYAPVRNAKSLQAQGVNPYQSKPGDTPAVGAWRQRMGTEAAQEIYQRRAATAEWANARLRNFGLQQMRVRGLVKARAVVMLFAMAHNLLQTVLLKGRKTGP